MLPIWLTTIKQQAMHKILVKLLLPPKFCALTQGLNKKTL